MRRPVPTLVLSGLVVLAGCSYKVHVRGVEVVPGGAEASGRAIWIGPTPETAGEDASVARMAPKLRWLLERRGYHVVSIEDADLALLFSSEIQPMVSRMRLQPPAGGMSGMTTVYREGPYERTLSLRLVRAAPFRKDQTEDTIWTGGAVLHGAPTESAKFEDAVLLAVFKQFPHDTGETIAVNVHLDSPQARKLREQTAEPNGP